MQNSEIGIKRFFCVSEPILDKGMPDIENKFWKKHVHRIRI